MWSNEIHINFLVVIHWLKLHGILQAADNLQINVIKSLLHTVDPEMYFIYVFHI